MKSWSRLFITTNAILLMMNPYIPAAILIVGFLSRVIPHAWDFTPVLALSLFAGAHLSGKRKYLVPLALMLLTDVVLGFYPSFLMTWAGVLASVAIGTILRRNDAWHRVAGCSLGAAMVFFIISNFGVWVTDYPKTWVGLADCYVMALPFFRNSLISTLIYSHVLIGGYAWMTRRASAKQVRVKL
jgi:hypothetical protein